MSERGSRWCSDYAICKDIGSRLTYNHWSLSSCNKEFPLSNQKPMPTSNSVSHSFFRHDFLRYEQIHSV